MKGWLRRIGAEVLAAVFFLGLAVLSTRPLAAHLETHLVGAGDPVVDLWTIDWSGSIGGANVTIRDQVEIVGGFMFTIAAAIQGALWVRELFNGIENLDPGEIDCGV